MRRVVGLFSALAALAGCGVEGASQLAPGDLVARLTEAGFTVEDGPPPPAKYPLRDGVHLYILHFAQPIDHAHPEAGTFDQRISLLHYDERAPRPMVVYTNGYADTWGFAPSEPAMFLLANQISIEHRFFGESRPATIDWQYLTIDQMVADEHAIIAALRPIYGGAFVSAGASKGGITAIAHRAAYPDDVAGTVLYSAPLSRGDDSGADRGYLGNLDAIGEPACRDALHAVTLELLRRRAELADLVALRPDRYSRVEPSAAIEAAITSLDWSFWQTRGIGDCGMVPAAPGQLTTTQLVSFLERYQAINQLADARLAELEPYYFQAYSQLGYPEGVERYITDGATLLHDDDDFLGTLPRGIPVPVYDAAPMAAIDRWVQDHGDRLLFLYGAWDPWAARRFALGGATRSALLEGPRAGHAVWITSLAAADRDRALGMLEDWTGVAWSDAWLPPGAATAAMAEDAGFDAPPPPAIGLALRGGPK
jgi:hypothetical protein